MSNSIWVEANTSSGQLNVRSLDHARSFRSILTESGWQTAQDHFSGGASGSPDIKVTHVGVAPSTVEVGEQVTVRARYRNDGDAPGGASHSAYEGSVGVAGLGPGETTTDSYSFTASRPGSHSINIGGKSTTLTVNEKTTDQGGLTGGGGSPETGTGDPGQVTRDPRLDPGTPEDSGDQTTASPFPSLDDIGGSDGSDGIGQRELLIGAAIVAALVVMR
jgi:hypothetical protein